MFDIVSLALILSKKTLIIQQFSCEMVTYSNAFDFCGSWYNL